MRVRFDFAAVTLAALVAGCGGKASGVPPTPDASTPDGSGNLGPAADAAATCTIAASNYDMSCTVDLDCVAGVEAFPGDGGAPTGFPVQFGGDWCSSAMCLCGGGTIGIRSAANYFDDVLRTPIGSGAIPPGQCGCPINLAPCCVAGQCTTGEACVGHQQIGGVTAVVNTSTNSPADAGDLDAYVLGAYGCPSIVQAELADGAPVTPPPSCPGGPGPLATRPSGGCAYFACLPQDGACQECACDDGGWSCSATP